MKILQIIPASGFHGKFVDSKDQYYTTHPLACWGLVKDDDGRTSIKGFGLNRSGALVPCDSFSDYAGYSAEPINSKRV